MKKHPHAGMQGAKRDFVKLVHDLVREGGRNHREVFADFLELAFCTLAKTTYPDDHPRAAELEARYMRTVEHRSADYIRRMPELLGVLQLGLLEPCDFLGGVSGELGALSDGLGQFFTPFEVSRLLAEITLQSVPDIVRERGFITIDEPACGAGGMVLAAAAVLEAQGLEPELHMLVRATDLSVTAFQMAYVQLWLRGVPATVVHGNTLTLETFAAEATLSKMRFAQHHGEAYLRWLRGEVEQLGAAAGKPVQVELVFDEPERKSA